MQLVCLLIAGVLVGQVVILLIVTLLPPPPPPLYRLTEIAAALNGQPVRPQDGPSFVRRQGAPPLPAADPRHASFVDAKRLQLAAVLGVDQNRVLLNVDHPRRTVGPWLWLGFSDHPPRSIHDHPGFHRPPRGGDELGAPGFGPFGPGEGDGILFGRFEAALRQPSGGWVVVAPKPDGFPNAWQSRVMLWFLGCLAVFGPAGYLFARRLVRPITAFAQAAERLGRDPRGELVELDGPGEIGVAARAFNDMHSRLKRYVDDRVAMVGAISHDLRTPLARIRFKAEAAPPAVRDAIASDIEQMEAMLAALLSFVRDAAEKPERVRLDLLSVLECVVDDAGSAGGDASLQADEPVVVEGDALALQRLFANLVDNAIKYGGRARVGLGVSAEDAVVTVADDGPGLALDDLERVFEPFYRGERSRSRDTGGAGLGLAVARSIARGHGGDVALRPGARGLVAEVRLPLVA